MKDLKTYKFLLTYDVVEIITVNGIEEAGLTHQVKELFEIKAHTPVSAELLVKAILIDTYSEMNKHLRIDKCELKEVITHV